MFDFFISLLSQKHVKRDFDKVASCILETLSLMIQHFLEELLYEKLLMILLDIIYHFVKNCKKGQRVSSTHNSKFTLRYALKIFMEKEIDQHVYNLYSR